MNAQIHRDFPELVAQFPVGATVTVPTAPSHDTVVGINRNGYVRVAASAYDRPGMPRITVDVFPHEIEEVVR